MEVLTKDFSQEVKDIDEKKGIVVAYANVYGNKDYDGDISAQGSFTKTISEGIKKLRVLKNHDTRLKLGVPLSVDATDPYGLLTTSQFNLQKSLAKDTFTDIQLELSNGQQSDLSIGYVPVKRDEKNKSIITEYKLHEYSFLDAWGANPLAIALDAKSISQLTDKEIIENIDLLVKMYNANYSDGKLAAIENALVTLDALKAADKGTLSNEAVLSEVKEWLKEKEQVLSLKNYLSHGN